MSGESLYISQDRISQTIQERTNVIRNLTPVRLTQALDQFRLGYLHQAVALWELVEERDTLVQTVVSKRKSACARREWEILTVQDAPEAEAAAQADCLREFYNNITATNIIEQDEVGDMELLISQMLDSVGRRYAVHEMVWAPRGDGSLACKFNYCPLSFFERTSGKLRFLPHNFASAGVPMDPRAWLVTVGPGLMRSTCVAQMFRSFSLRDWLGYCEKYGFPGVLGKTSATPGSQEWRNMEDAVSKFARDFAAVMNQDSVIELIEAAGSGVMPFAELQEVMARFIIIQWHGGDLGTMSKGNGNGASLQQDSCDVLTEEDCHLINGTLSKRVSPLVLRQRFGPNVRTYAYFHLIPPLRQDSAKDIAIDTALAGWGVRLGKRDAAERYGRKLADDDEEALGDGAPQAQALRLEPAALANESTRRIGGLAQNTEQAFGEALATSLREVSSQLVAAALPDPDERDRKLHELALNLSFLGDTAINDPRAAQILADAEASAFANGVAAGEVSP